MSDMDLQIKISLELQNSLKELKSLGGLIKSLVNDIKNSFKGVSTSITANLQKAGQSLQAFGNAVDNVEKKFKKFGRELSQNVTLPLVALATLSLKNVFDKALEGTGTASMNAFAGAVQELTKEFKDLTLEIGEALAPVMTSVISKIIDGIKWFRSLSDTTKNTLLVIAGIAAALGPMSLAIASVLSVVSQLSLAFGKFLTYAPQISSFFSGLSSVLSAPVIAIAAIVTSIIGLINVFAKLREAGVDTFEAIELTLTWFATQFGNLVGGNILKTIEKLIGGLGGLASLVNEEFGNKMMEAAQTVGQFADEAQKSANDAEKAINDKLAKIGTTAGQAFTFNLFKETEKQLNNKEFKVKISADEQRRLIESADINKQLEILKKQHDANIQNLESEHINKMKQLDQTNDPKLLIEQRYQAQVAYLLKKQELERQDLERAIAKDLKLAQLETNAQQRRNAVSDVNNKARVEKAKLADQQETENKKLETEKQLELERVKNEKITLETQKYQQVAQSFSGGLSNAMIDFADGTETASVAFSKFASSFLRQMAQMIIEATIMQSIMGALGFSQTSSGGWAKVQNRANGGPVYGPGTSTSDSIPARLSNGEYVIRAAAVKKYGVNFFNSLNSMRDGLPMQNEGFVKKYADGGLVTSSSQAPQVVIQNSGTPKETQSTSFDPSTGVLSIILDDLNKNGSLAKNLQSTYGLKRGAFR